MGRSAVDNHWMAVAIDFELVGREEELGRLENFVGTLAQGATAAVVRGDAGIGKTVFWHAGIEAAEQAGVRVLVTRCIEAEMPIALGGVADALDPAFHEVTDELFEPQRRLLASALGVEPPSADAPDQTALPRAFLAYLRALAGRGQVLVAIDDAQWLDPPSQRTIAYAARRLVDEPVGFLVTQRGHEGDPLGLRQAFGERLGEIRLGPLTLGALHHVIRTRLGVRLPRPTVARIRDASGGNPMFALEFAKEASRARGPLPLPGSLEELVGDRVARLPADVLLLLACVAAAERPTTSLLEAVVDNARALLDAAVIEGTVTLDVDAVVRFTHPLLVSAAYAAVPPSARQKLHAELAAVTSDDEQRARHLALATTEPDAEVALALDAAAAGARSRGAPEAAAELARHAIRLTPRSDGAERLERLGRSASYLSGAGDISGARAVLDDVLGAPISGDGRARALLHAARIDEDYARIGELAQEALGHVQDDALRIHALVTSAVSRVEQGDAAGEAIATEALAAAEGLGDPALLADALVNLGYVRWVSGHPEPALLQRAVELGAQRPSPSGLPPPGVPLTLLTLWAGELRDARCLLEREVDAAYAWGDERLMETLRRLFVALEWWEGNWNRAEARLDEHSHFVFDAGDRAAEVHGLWQQALLAASRGRVEEARERARETVRRAQEHQLALFVVIGRWVEGFLDLSLDVPDAWESLRLVPITEHPQHIWFFPDVVEAAVASDRLDEAERVLAALESQARAREHRWATSAASRSRALLLLARGESQAAVAAAEEAAAGLEAAGFPLDHGRALVVAGEALRRLGERRRAAEKLEAARQIFAKLGAPLWLARAEKELRRASPRPRHDGELTSAERRVAALVAAGRTNREVAAKLFITTGTVEVHLTRIYRKVGVRSRTELARLAADGTLDLGDAKP
jgi:DNA-binding CsgD family transcriptional regulator